MRGGRPRGPAEYPRRDRLDKEAAKMREARRGKVQGRRKVMIPDGWRITNIREHHLRVGGKIVGKIVRYWANLNAIRAVDRLSCWTSIAYQGRTRRIVGWRRDADKARALVDRALQPKAAK